MEWPSNSSLSSDYYSSSECFILHFQFLCLRGHGEGQFCLPLTISPPVAFVFDIERLYQLIARNKGGETGRGQNWLSRRPCCVKGHLVLQGQFYSHAVFPLDNRLNSLGKNGQLWTVLWSLWRSLNGSGSANPSMEGRRTNPSGQGSFEQQVLR